MAIRKDLDGLRVKSQSAGTVYLIDQGKKRRVGNGAYEALFQWGPQVMDVDGIDTGTDLIDGSVLVAIWRYQTAYLIDLGKRIKRPIASEQTFQHYGFRGVTYVPPSILDFVPDGPLIEWPEP
jgi:hypothetical protein